MRIACSATAFPSDSLDRAIQKVAWAGYGGVELTLDGPDLPDEESLRQRLQVEELELTSLYAGSIPAGQDSAAMEELVRVGRVAAMARALHGSVVVVSAPAAGKLPALAGALALLDRALGGTDVDLALVNRAGTLLEKPQDFTMLWDAGLPERVGIALDPGAAHDADWDAAELDTLPVLPRHVYLTDRRGTQPVPAGDGEIHLSAIVDALRVRGYSGALCLKLEGADPWSVEPVVKEIRELSAAWLG